jgi:hypothetical protein
MARKTTTETTVDKTPFEKVSTWALDNAPAVIGITIASIIGGVIGFGAGIAMYGFLQYYRQTR